MHTILVPLDGSAFAGRALPTAIALARASGSTLCLVRVVVAQPFLRADLEAEDELHAVASQLRADGLNVTTHIEIGPVADGIVRAANELDADLIVMSTHGRGGIGRWYYGSVADEVLRRSPVVVLLVRATAQVAPPAKSDGRVVVPLDGSAFGEVALEPALSLARTLGADVVLLRVVEPIRIDGYAQPYGGFTQLDTSNDVERIAVEARAYLASVSARLPSSDVKIGTRIEIGDPATLVASVAREASGSVIAMATHGSTGLARLATGSVSTATLQHATVPVLLVRPVQIVHPVSVDAPIAGASTESRTNSAATSATFDLAAGDIERLRYGLDLLVGTVDRDPTSTAAIQSLDDRLSAALSRARQVPVNGAASAPHEHPPESGDRPQVQNEARIVGELAEKRPGSVVLGAREGDAAPADPTEPSPNPLVGTWRLVTIEVGHGPGAGDRFTRADPSGSLSYDADGRMSVQVAVADRPAAAFPRDLDPGGTSYSGTYESYLDPFSPDRDRVTHHVQAGSVPSGSKGESEKREVTLLGDTLTWHGAQVDKAGHPWPGSNSEHPWTVDLVWKRTAAPR